MKKILVLIMMLAAFAGTLVLTGCGDLEGSAKPLVTKILKENGVDAKCTAVKITKKLEKNKHLATATLDSGDKLDIIIEQDGDMIYVTIVDDGADVDADDDDDDDGDDEE